MDEVLLLFAGELGPPVKLGDMVRQMHAEALERDRERRERKARLGVGSPDEESTWKTATALADALVTNVHAQDAAKARAVLQQLSDALWQAPQNLDAEPQIEPGVANIALTMAAMSEADKRVAGARIATAFRARKAARDKLKGDDDAVGFEEWATLDHAVYAAQRELVKKTARKISGIKRRKPDGAVVAADDVPVDDDVCDALRAAGVFEAVFMVCDRFQTMPPGKAARFGLPPR